MPNIYYIIPLNEGQDMNYNESFDGSVSKAIERAKYLQDNLQNLLKQGTITVKVEGDEVDWFVGDNGEVNSYS